MDFALAEPADEGRLVDRIAAGDEEALAFAYERYAALIYATVVRFSGDRERSAEVVQDTFLALWRRAHQFHPAAGSLAGWLLAIARHRAIDDFRASARRPATITVPAPDADARATVDDPTSWAERRWAQSVVRGLVERLPAAEREVLVLAYAGGLSQAEIADRTGLPLGTVKSRTRRALARLRVELSRVPDIASAATGGTPSAPQPRSNR